MELNLNQSYDIEVDAAYIIVVKDNPTSERMFLRCAKSCEDVGMPWKRWEAFDGTHRDIRVPDHLKNEKWISWIKVANDVLAPTEVAVMLTNISLWEHCIYLQKPIVILEHDAFMIRKFLTHPVFNTIVYLGSLEQVQNNFFYASVPIMGQLNSNYRFICRSHACSIDPFMARRLFSAVISDGITTSIDVMIRSDIYSQIQMGIYAFDMADNVSTCCDRLEKHKDPKLVKINNKIL